MCSLSTDENVPRLQSTYIKTDLFCPIKRGRSRQNSFYAKSVKFSSGIKICEHHSFIHNEDAKPQFKCKNTVFRSLPSLIAGNVKPWLRSKTKKKKKKNKIMKATVCSSKMGLVSADGTGLLAG